MSVGWEPIPWKLSFLRSRWIKRAFRERTQLALDWRPAVEADWPPEEVLSDDLDWVRKTGTGFVADRGNERLFLFNRDWFGWPDPPEWGLASVGNFDGKWHLWGSFDTLPETWKVPELVHAED
ncbi:MAG: hypothetical protein ACRYFW_17320 [Janthinobacterium lividum]